MTGDDAQAPEPDPDPEEPAEGPRTPGDTGQRAAGPGAAPAADQAKAPTNPFLVPFMELNPRQPLVPWRFPTHNDYYVPVDDTQAAYDRFLAAVNHDARTLRDHGRLIAVLGGTGCGKTSLRNRCVGWLKAELTKVEIRPFVLECNQPPDQDKPLDRQERMSVVCRRVVIRTKRQLGLAPSFAAELDKYESTPADLYDCLGEVLDAVSHSTDAVLIILLPDTDLAAEIVAYAQLIRPRLVFCVESSTVVGPIPWPAAVRAAVAPPIELRVNPLGPNDAVLFRNARLPLHDGDSEMPTVSEDVMSKLSGSRAAANIAGLVGLMYGIYEEKLSQPPPYTPVTIDDLTRYLLDAFVPRTAS